jgi:hypothetical protein
MLCCVCVCECCSESIKQANTIDLSLLQTSLIGLVTVENKIVFLAQGYTIIFTRKPNSAIFKCSVAK